MPGASERLRTGLIVPPLPISAPPCTQRAIVFLSAGVRIRRSLPMKAGESGPGGHGGMTPSWVIVKMAAACALADPAEVIEKGAIPPGMWQPAHLAAKIGATSVQPGVLVRGEAVDGEESRAIAAASPAPTATATARTTTSLRRRIPGR